jgi:hypothetical protein
LFKSDGVRTGGMRWMIYDFIMIDFVDKSLVHDIILPYTSTDYCPNDWRTFIKLSAVYSR